MTNAFFRQRRDSYLSPVPKAEQNMADILKNSQSQKCEGN